MDKKPAPKAHTAHKAAAKEPETTPVPAAPPKQVEKPAKMVKIKMLRSHPRLAYSEGDTGEIPQSVYDSIIGDGPFFEAI